MSETFADPLSEGRIALYWEDVAAQLTLDEWHAACKMARQRETFHKVPLPAVLMGYVREYRVAEQARRLTAEQARRVEMQGMAGLLPLRTQPTDAEVLDAIRNIVAMLEEKMDMGSPTGGKAWRTLLTSPNPPDQTRWLPLTEEMS